MGLSTKNTTDRKAKIANMIEHHKSKVKNIGTREAPFFPKFPYIPKGGAEQVVAFYESEIKNNVNVYVEFTDDNFDISDPERKLWMWIFDKDFKTKYDTTEPHPITGHVRYMIPIKELILVKDKEDEEVLTIEDELPDPETDQPMSQMTIRDYAAIHLRKPVSHKKWLNDIIKD